MFRGTGQVELNSFPSKSLQFIQLLARLTSSKESPIHHNSPCRRRVPVGHIPHQGTMTHNISELPGVKSRDEDPFTADSDLLLVLGAAVNVWPP